MAQIYSYSKRVHSRLTGARKVMAVIGLNKGMIIPRFRIQEDCCSNVNSVLEEKNSGPRSLLQWPREKYKAWATVVAEEWSVFWVES